MEDFFLLLFFKRSVMGDINVEKCLIKRRYHEHKPMNLLISVVFVGWGKFTMEAILSGSVFKPFASTTYPK